MDMGLAGMGGAAGAGDALQTLFEQRMQAAAAQRQQQTIDQNDALTRLKLQEHADEIRQRVEAGKQAEKDRADAAKAAAQDRQEKMAASTFAMNPVGADLGPKMGAQAQSLGFPVSRIPGAQVQQTSGFMPLPSAPPQGPGMQPIGGLTPITGPQAPAGQSATTADPQNAMNAPDRFTRGATQVDVEKGKADALAAAKPDAAVEAARVAQENRQENLRLIAALKPPPADKLVKVEHRGPDGRTVIEWLPESERRGKMFEKPVNATTENRLASAEAVQQTGADIIAKMSDPRVTTTLGPALGRVSKLSDFIGSPPPEFSELAGQIESYALASMGVHGMRSAQGAEKIKALLDGHHTPESLAAAVKGLNGFASHFMENEGRGPHASGTKLTAEELIKKYGGS